MSAVVYRLFDADDALLYIGWTSDLETRMLQHLRWAPSRFGIPGWLEIRGRYARHEVTVYATDVAARNAERAAIRAEAPLYNRQHNPTRWCRKGGTYYVPVEVTA